MARGIAGKFLRGVNAVAAPAALAQQQSNIEQKRMQILQGYAQQNMQAQQDFNIASDDRRQGYAVENLETAQGYAEDNREADQAFSRVENAADRSIQADRNNMEGEGLQLEKDRFEIAKEQAEITLETANLGLGQQKRLEGLYQTIIDPNASDDVRSQAAESILQLTGKGAEDRYSALYEDITDETGFPTGGRNTFILNSRTGVPSPISFQPQQQDDDPLGIRQRIRK
tara:strand:- start:675 stop:1358 length:684 start_codon:yes stop_codon:yes gene_type:complete